jgi:hypothetical protein
MGIAKAGQQMGGMYTPYGIGQKWTKTLDKIEGDRMPLKIGDQFSYPQEEYPCWRFLKYGNVTERRWAVLNLKMVQHKLLIKNHGRLGGTNEFADFEEVNPMHAFPIVVGSTTLEALVKALEDEDWLVRADAADVLWNAYKADMFAVDPHIATVHEKLLRICERHSIVDSFRKHREWNELELQPMNETIVVTVLNLLEGAGRMQEAFAPYNDLLPAFLYFKDWRIRYAAIIAMWHQGDDRKKWMTDIWGRMTQDENAEVQEMAHRLWERPFEKVRDWNDRWKFALPEGEGIDSRQADYYSRAAQTQRGRNGAPGSMPERFEHEFWWSGKFGQGTRAKFQRSGRIKPKRNRRTALKQMVLNQRKRSGKKWGR